MRTIQAFQHADAHGVVCPAGWKPGAKTIVPDQDKSKEYFKELWSLITINQLTYQSFTVDKFLKLLRNVCWDVFPCEMLEADIDLVGDFVDFWIFLEQLDERFDSLCQINFAIVVDVWVRITLNTDVISWAMLELGVLWVELFWVGIYFDSNPIGRLLLLANYLD